MQTVAGSALIGRNYGNAWSAFVLTSSSVPSVDGLANLPPASSPPSAVALNLSACKDGCDSGRLFVETVALPQSSSTTSQALWLADALMRPVGSLVSASISPGRNPVTVADGTLAFGNLRLSTFTATYVVFSPASFDSQTQVSYLNKVSSEHSWLPDLDYSSMGWALLWTVLILFVIGFVYGLLRIGYGVLKTALLL